MSEREKKEWWQYVGIMAIMNLLALTVIYAMRAHDPLVAVIAWTPYALTGLAFLFRITYLAGKRKGVNE